MASSIQNIMIGLFIVIAVYVGGINFVSTGYTNYNVTSNSSIYLNATNQYLTDVSAYTNQTQGYITTANSILPSEFTSIGIIFNQLGSFVVSIFSLGGFITTMLSSLFGANNSLFIIPDEFLTIIGGIVATILILSGIAFLIGRARGDI